MISYTRSSMGYEIVGTKHRSRRARVSARACGAPQIDPSSLFPAAYHSGTMAAGPRICNRSDNDPAEEVAVTVGVPVPADDFVHCANRQVWQLQTLSGQ